MAAAGTNFLKGCFRPKHNAHLQLPFRLDHEYEIGGIDPFVIRSADNFIITSFDNMTSEAIPTMTLDNVVEILVCADVEAE
jgi:hypothetical protein